MTVISNRRLVATRTLTYIKGKKRTGLKIKLKRLLMNMNLRRLKMNLHLHLPLTSQKICLKMKQMYPKLKEAIRLLKE